MTIRQRLGVAGLIIAANTAIANVAWKVFLGPLCVNAAQGLRQRGTCPLRGLAAEAGVPTGVLNVVQGYSEDAGQAASRGPARRRRLFTGSTAVGRVIAWVAGERLAKICLELGGKNPLVVCDDANLDKAVDAAALSAFSNAGQRAARRRDHASSCSTRSTTASGSFSWSGRRRRRSGRPTTTSGP
jgi:alpha-ketoglutaric semialdehyde dehydrogenase